MRKRHAFIFVLGACLVVAAAVLAGYASRLWGAGRLKWRPLSAGNLHRDTAREERDSLPGLRPELLDYWSSRPLGSWEKRAKVEDPRIILACLMKGKRIGEVNAFLLRQVPAATAGSRWALHPRGDYDFTLLGLTPLLYLFGDRPDLLYPATLRHLLDVLLTAEGGSFTTRVPRTLGLIEDTENHLLMTNGSRYLKNRWLFLHGSRAEKFDNARNGLRRALLDYLLDLYRCGLYEFNSEPYQGYTLSALLNLQAFAGDSVRLMAEKILDRVCTRYAFGSLDFKRYPPFRRRYDRASRTSFTRDYTGVMMKVWASFSGAVPPVWHGGYAHALWAAVLPYRPPRSVISRVLDPGGAYFIRMGHGKGASPEIYSADSALLLSAGGVSRGRRSFLIARPIVLITASGGSALDSVFHLEGPGDDFRKWNNTGVYRNFACAAGPVHVPEGRLPAASVHNWSIYELDRGRLLACYSTPALGIMAVCRAGSPAALLDELVHANPDTSRLKRVFVHPDGDLIVYDVRAARNRWVIASVNGRPADRRFDSWPFFWVDSRR